MCIKVFSFDILSVYGILAREIERRFRLGAFWAVEGRSTEVAAVWLDMGSYGAPRAEPSTRSPYEPMFSYTSAAPVLRPSTSTAGCVHSFPSMTPAIVTTH